MRRAISAIYHARAQTPEGRSGYRSGKSLTRTSGSGEILGEDPTAHLHGVWGTEDLHGIWGSSSTNVWAVGQGGIVHWNGAAWSSTASGTTDKLNSVWGSAANDVWAVSGGGRILHWAGSAWGSFIWSGP